MHLRHFKSTHYILTYNSLYILRRPQKTKKKIALSCYGLLRKPELYIYLRITMNINSGCFHFTIFFLIAGSYKLWYRYLRLRRQQVRGRCVTDPLHDQVSNCFERALVFMHKMPRIWMDYCSYLGKLVLQ